MLRRTITPQYVTLTSGQLLECKQAAIHREQDSAQRGLHDRRAIERNDSYMKGQELSFMAELAFSQYLGIPAQTGVGQMNQPDITYKERFIDVKTSNGRCANMNVSPESLKPDWYYVYVTGDAQNGQFSIIGSIKGEDIASKATKTNYGYEHRPMVWSVPQYQLKPFSPRSNES